MQRIVTAVLVATAVAFGAGGVAVTGRADPAQGRAPVAHAQGQCQAPARVEVKVDAKAAELAAKDDVVPLNTAGYNYDAYEDQWRPEIRAAAPPVPAAPAKP